MRTTSTFLRAQGPHEALTEIEIVDHLDVGSWSLRIWLAWAAVPAVMLLAVLSGIVWLGEGVSWRAAYITMQRDWFFLINSRLSVWPDSLWANLTLLGDASILMPFLFPLTIWYRRAWVAILGAAMPAAILSAAGKHIAALPRPAAVLNKGDFIVIGDALTAHNSLPSGHSITVFAGAIAILATIFPHPRKWRHWLILITGLVLTAILCLSRVAVGAHWPLDLFVGAACGWMAGLAGAAIVRARENWQWMVRSDGCRVTGSIFFIWSALLVSRAMYEPIDNLVIWLSVTCGTFTSLWLLGVRPRV